MVSESNVVTDFTETDSLIELPIYSECKNYRNNLSEIAEEVHFVVLDTASLIRDFHVSDIEISDDYIFLTGLYDIRQFTRNGKYVRDIGRRGQGPTEYAQLSTLIQLDRQKQWVYAKDVMQHKINVYGFDGAFVKALPSKRGTGDMVLIDSNLIAMRQSPSERFFSSTQDVPKIRFVDAAGKLLKSYKSSLYPYEPFQENRAIRPGETRRYGDDSPLWNYQQNYSYWEYASDTIYRIVSDFLQPRYALTGALKPTGDDYFTGETGNRFLIYPTQLVGRTNSCIFESGRYLIFHMNMMSGHERFYMLYNKRTRELFRTYYSDAPVLSMKLPPHKIMLMDYFVDDIYSGFHFTPEYQSDGYAMALIPTERVLENKDEILERLKNDTSPEAQNLKHIVENISEFDNSLLMMVKFK
jgi:hypothetical protein